MEPAYPPGTEGLKLASFDQLRTLSQKYCLLAKTRILCSDFMYLPLSEISVGDEISRLMKTLPVLGSIAKCALQP